MPFKSKAQQRFMFAAENRGEVPKGTAERWAKYTPDIKALPEYKKTASEIADAVIEKIAMSNEEWDARFLTPHGKTREDFDRAVELSRQKQLQGLAWGAPIGAGVGGLFGLGYALASKRPGKVVPSLVGAGIGGGVGGLTGALVNGFTPI
jgi:hypothetical protein